MSHQYTVINASAGSGKTYALVQKLLMICLKFPNQPENIRHILALTFTNKAANEMKQRILNWLKDFSSENYTQNSDLQNIKEKLDQENIHISLEELHRRSKQILDYILHRYSTLNIGTIDKFNSKLVHSFTHELGLAQNFNLEIQAEPFLMEAVDKMLDEIGENAQISDAFMDFVNYSLDNDERISLNQTLYNSAKEFVQDKHYFHLNENKNFDWNVYENTKQKLRNEIRNLKKESAEITKNILKILDEKNLDISDFAGGNQRSIAKFFFETDKYFRKERENFPLPENEISAMENFLKGTSSTAKHKNSEISEILNYLIETRQKLISNHILSQKKEKILAALLPLKVNKEIQDKLAEIEEENDLVLLPKFNVMIHENLSQEPSAFIYEKIGTQFSHYFFDEFQDTSQLQWKNFLPLRNHTISSKDMSFTLVGDPKQSIYRFRGGDSQMMLDIIRGKEEIPVKANVENLENNWRSAKNIVKFNNDFYKFLSETGNLNDDFKDIFGKGSQQNAKSENPGRVRINFIENSTKEILHTEIAEKMRDDIQNCLDHGFKFSDITILCRGNTEIYGYSALLGNMKVNYGGNLVPVKTISEKGLTLNLSSTILAVTEFLKWELNPKNTAFLVKMMYHLNVSERIKMQDFSAEMMEILDQKETAEIKNFIRKKYDLNLKQTDIPMINLYNFTEYFVREFSVEHKETDFLLNFLELLYNFSRNPGFTLKDFLKYWDEEGGNTSIQTSKNIDAVQIMTIHKAKGLEFPVVFLPMENENKDGKFTGWIPANEENLGVVNISPFDRKLENYDEEMQNFNRENTYRNKIDRFCLLYVATTRAVEQMFFYLEKPNKSANNLEIFEFAEKIRNEKFNSNHEEKPDSFDVFETDEQILRKQNRHKKENFHTQSIDLQKNTTAKTSIKIATPSKNYQSRNEKVRTGIFTHEVLSKINSAKDISRVLDSYVLNGNITNSEKQTISERIIGIVSNPKYSEYFSENAKIMNERDLMISENGETFLYRPDRIIETENGFTIIDFKTGEENPKHEKQVENYKNALEKLGKKVAKTEVVYL
ncbi:MAG: UvrD-helicase domain-containing protein [Flavobacteriaceae bacterium]|jgi:ATP-dependent exoDNAse (exonuclease V) beta subunit|nr:UvrD-helicase domain-containing protein [Flavobacteriaceae bacterium]